MSLHKTDKARVKSNDVLQLNHIMGCQTRFEDYPAHWVNIEPFSESNTIWHQMIPYHMASFLRACPELSFAANEQGAFSSSENNFSTCRTTNTLEHKSRDRCAVEGMWIPEKLQKVGFAVTHPIFFGIYSFCLTLKTEISERNVLWLETCTSINFLLVFGKPNFSLDWWS
jgi:hypothetical protein